MQKQKSSFIIIFIVAGILYASPSTAGMAEVADDLREKGKAIEPGTEKVKGGEKEKKTEDQKEKKEVAGEEKPVAEVQYLADEVPEMVGKKEEESVFGFNFLYYIIQRFKLSDFTVQ